MLTRVIAGLKPCATTPLKPSATTPLKPSATTSLKPSATTPLKPCATTPLKRYATTPLKSLAAAGFAGGLAGALAMNLYARAVGRATGGHEAEGAARGSDRNGRGMQPPQADGRAEEDAAVQVGSLAYETVTGDRPDRRTRSWLGSAAHYAFGGGAGATYALAACRVPMLRTGRGLLYGALVWAIADQGITPALGLSRSPRQLTPGMHAYSLVGHLVYGATLDAVLSRSIAKPDAIPV
jgi:hypothetical protein